MKDQEFTTLANGGELSEQSFNDFIARLTHDCRGEGVKDHITSNAIFTVQYNKLITGLDTDYTDNLGCYFDSSFSGSIDDFLADIGADHEADDNFAVWLKDVYEQDFEWLLSESRGEQAQILRDFDQSENGWFSLTICGYEYEWTHINSHFTKDAAERFIERKKHDYGEMRVYVNSQYYAWEFNAIMGALMDGKLILNPDLKQAAISETV